MNPSARKASSALFESLSLHWGSSGRSFAFMLFFVQAWHRWRQLIGTTLASLGYAAQACLCALHSVMPFVRRLICVNDMLSIIPVT
jgi:hypothetical protein